MPVGLHVETAPSVVAPAVLQRYLRGHAHREEIDCREGLVVYLPDDRRLDLTEMVLLAAGLRVLPARLELTGEALA
jgi:hypothetical protein